MKRFYKKVFKSKKPSLVPIHEPGPATSPSTLITRNTDLMPSILATSNPIASAEVTAGVNVSVRLRPSHLNRLNVIKQTAHNLGISMSALEISDLPQVSVPELASI